MNSKARKTTEPARGPGRPQLQPGEQTKVMTLRLTDTQHAKLGRLGGAPWVRERIDKAREK